MEDNARLRGPHPWRRRVKVPMDPDPHPESDRNCPDQPLAASAGVDRRGFLSLSLAAAAGSTLGAGMARAQGGAAATPAAPQPQAGQPVPPPPPVPLGNGEATALQFQPYPGGTGAMMEKLARERGHAAFERTVFTVSPWTGPMPVVRRRDRVPAGPSARRAPRGEADHVRAADRDLPRAAEAAQPHAPVRRHGHGRVGARRGGPRRRGDQGRQVPRSAPRPAVRHQGHLRDQGRPHDVGRRRFREPDHRRRRRGRRPAEQAPARCSSQSSRPGCSRRTTSGSGGARTTRGTWCRDRADRRRARPRRPSRAAWRSRSAPRRRARSSRRRCAAASSALRPTFGRVSRTGAHDARVVDGPRGAALPHRRRLRDGL